MADAVPLLTGLAPIADRYDGFLIDLWGTIHDGTRPWPGAVECLLALKARGKRILVLSNAPRVAALSVSRMDEMGIPRGAYDAVLTSGDSVRAALIARADPWHARLGRRCYLMGPPKDDSVLDDTQVERVPDLATADFIVNVGAYRRADTLDMFEAELQAARARALPMVCANPDLVVLRGEARELCAGAIAERYQALGGDVRYHGKPHAPIYADSLRLLGLSDPRRVLAIGDSLRTDIAGARAAGMDAVLVYATGILAERLGCAPDGAADPALLAALYAEAGVQPTAAMPALRW